MSRYIDADMVIGVITNSNLADYEYGLVYPQSVITAINNISTADVEEVRHGKWEHGREIRREYIGDALLAIYYDKWWCSQCHYTIDDHHYSKITYKRCPECGAKMDKEKEE